VSWIAPEVTRIDEPFVADERTMLDGWLEWQRATLLCKCAGLTAEQLAERPVPPSSLSLLGLVRHQVDVERTWFRRRFAGEQVTSEFSRPDQPDAAFDEASPDRAEADFACLIREWGLVRRAVAGASLDDEFVSERWGQMSLRWLYQHMITEYSRHNGHADLLRERIDGATGL
jgi:uncharacterized damage-inducible protein DinB